MGSKELLNHKIDQVWEPETIIPTQDSLLATEPLMLVSLELLQESLVNTSPTRSSIPAETETTTEDKQTTESLVETPETFSWVPLLALLVPPLPMLLLEILVEDKRLL